MNENAKATSLVTFKRLNYVFWAIWALVPFSFYTLWKSLNYPMTDHQGMTPEQVSCVKGFFDPTTFSSLGQLIYNLPLISAFSFIIILIFNFHRMVNRFAKGAVFDSFTLRGMKTLGYTLIAFPFFDFALGHFVSAAMRYIGDLSYSSPPILVDFTVVAAGFFMIALMIVLKNAIDIKSENDLTI